MKKAALVALMIGMVSPVFAADEIGIVEENKNETATVVAESNIVPGNREEVGNAYTHVEGDGSAPVEASVSVETSVEVVEDVHVDSGLPYSKLESVIDESEVMRRNQGRRPNILEGAGMVVKETVYAADRLIMEPVSDNRV